MGLFLPCQIRGVEMYPREVLVLRWPGGWGREAGRPGCADSGLISDCGYAGLGGWVIGLDFLDARARRWRARPRSLTAALVEDVGA